MTQAAPAPDPAPEPAPGRPRRGLHRAALSLAWKTVAIVLMAAGVLLITLRLSLPGISHYRADIEQWISDALDVPVSIGSLQADWSGWTPVLRIENVRVVQHEGGETVARFAHASVSMDLPESLRRGELLPGDITLTGATFRVMRRADGSVSFSSGEQPGEEQASSAGSVATGSALPWLLRHRRLELRDTDVLWMDPAGDAPPLLFSDVELEARNDGERHQFEGSLQLPEQMGGRLAFVFDATGDIMTPAWSGEAYLRGKRILPAGWSALQRGAGLRAVSGSGELELWTTWRNARLQRADGSLAFADLVLAHGDRGALDIRRGSTDLSLWRSELGFDADLELTQLETEHGAWPATALSLGYIAAAAERPARITGELGFLRAQDLLGLVADRLPPELAGGERAVAAELHDLSFSFTPGEDGIEDLHAVAGLRGLGVPAVDNLPGVEGLDGHIEIAGDRGRLQLDGDDFVFDYPAQLPGRLPVRQASGQLSWARSDSGWQVDAERLQLMNEDLAARVRGSVRFRADEPHPFLRLVVQVQRGSLAALKRYLPRGLLPEDVADWLRRGLPSGEILGGEVLLHGLLQEFPFDKASGRLQARVEVANVRLDYHSGWPSLEGVHGYVMFDGRGLEVVADEGRVQDSDIVHARASVDDLGADSPLLRISGRVTGTTENAVAFLAASPLRTGFADAMAAVQITGPSELDLELEIPLTDEEARVQGTLRLVGNTVEASGLRRGLQGLSGTLRFSESSIRSSGLEALYLGQRLRLDIRRDDNANATRVGLSGQADRDLLRSHLRNVGLPSSTDSGAGLLLDHGTGGSDFDATLVLPDGWGDAGATIRLSVRSSLEGLSLALPAPVGKTAEEQRPLQLEVDIRGNGGRALRFAYGTALAGVFELRGDADGPALTRGTLLFGAHGDTLPGTDRLPDGEHVRLAGDVGRLSLNDWYATVNAASGGAPEALAGAAMLGRIAEMDLRGEVVHLLGLRLDDVHLEARRDGAGAWTLRFDGPDLAGRATLPSAPAGVLDVDLDHLVLREEPRKGDDDHAIDDQDPRTLPGMDFACGSLVFGDLDLGRVTLITRAIAGGLEVQTLQVSSPAFEATGSGRWTGNGANGSSTSSFSVQLDSERLGEMLAAFGYEEDAVEGGSTRVNLDARWPGAPTEFSLERTQGTLRVLSGPGRLLEVSPGAAGRMFGLLSLGSLPRRLRLDFGDLFGDGYSFERIEGKFALAGGNAYTNDLSIDGSAARIDISGRTGLVARDYDQQVTVTPKLASTLPLAGAVLGPAGAGVGAVIWLAEKVFNRSLVDRMAAYRYTITGSWEDPQVEPEKTVPRVPGNLDERG